MIFFDIEQNTDEWKEARKGKITGSALGKIMANEQGAFGQPAHAYALQLALERITGKINENNYSNQHMERGHKQEPIARMLYEETFFADVSNGGFFDLGNIGCSPDGLVGSDGIIEIKSVIPTVHFANVKRNHVDPAYKWQHFGNLKFTKRDWIDFVSYCQDYPKGKKLFTYRIYKKQCRGYFRRIDKRVSQFEKLIQHKMKEILK